ncbi:MULTISPECIES: protein L [Enterobacter]|uniref:protein L n=1 Tax=Enterobacter TaxID=547 RepID=UPI001E5DB2BA|nr:protein L [Enterobacter ludwigii]MCE2009028.1 protein L [Enterobacter ludwigii]
MAAFTSETEQFLQRVEGDKERWTSQYNPGDTVPVSGIYRCTVCGKEVTSNKDDPFPPQNHHQHSSHHETDTENCPLCADETLRRSL